jgi:hypothetical protein
MKAFRLVIEQRLGALQKRPTQHDVRATQREDDTRSGKDLRVLGKRKPYFGHEVVYMQATCVCTAN